MASGSEGGASAVIERGRDPLDIGGSMWCGEVDDREVEAGGLELVGLMGDGGEVGFGVDEDVLRHGDLARVAADEVALLLEQSTCRDEVVGVASGEVPVLGVAGDEGQGASRSSASDADRGVWLLDRFWFASRGSESVMLSVVIGGLVGEERDDHVDSLVESVEAFGERAELDAVSVAFLEVPSGAESEFETSSRDDVEAGGHVREHGRVSVDDTVDHGADSDPLGGLGERGEGDPGLEAGPGGVVGVDGVEVIEVPSRLEQFDPVGFAPDVEHVGPGGVLGRRLDRVSHAGTIGEQVVSRRWVA